MIEMFFTMAIIAVLVVIAAPRILSHTASSKVTQMRNDITAVSHNVDVYSYANNDTLPAGLPVVPINDMDVYIEEGRLYSMEGQIDYYIDGKFYKINDTALMGNTKTKLDGDYIVDTYQKVYYAHPNVVETPDVTAANKFCSYDVLESATGQYRTEDNGDGTISIVKYLGSDREIVIPSEIGGKTVTRIASDIDWTVINANPSNYYNPDGNRNTVAWEPINDGFYHRNITKVYLPCTLTEIGEDSFSNNPIKSLVIPDSVVTINDYAFYYNDIRALRIGSGLNSIGSEAFAYNLIDYLRVPANVDTIKDGAFYGNGIKEIEIANGIRYIGNNTTTNNYGAFENNNIKILTIPETVINVGNSAFRNNRLQYLDLGTNVSIIGDMAFTNNLLTAVDIPSSVYTINQKAFFTNQIRRITIPGTITGIEDLAFARNASRDGSATIGSIVINGMEYIESLNAIGDIVNESDAKITPLHGINMGDQIFNPNAN